MRTIYLPLLAALLTLTGCDKDAQSIEAREERDPLVNSGQAFMDEQNWDKAISAFTQALENEPTMARPHIDLALIYQQHRINYIHAIYHYDRYLELRPDSEKAEFINEQKLKVAQALANTLINNSPEVKKVVQERNQLAQENSELKRQLTLALKEKTSDPVAETKSTTVTRTVPKSAQSEPVKQTTAQTGHKIYNVKAGDNLTKIAQEFYGTGDWEPIFEANKDMMRSPGDLRVGQTLVIPNL